MILISAPKQDTCEHTTLDDLIQQLLYDGSSKQTTLNQLKIRPQDISNFNMDSTELHQKQNDLPKDSSPLFLISS